MPIGTTPLTIIGRSVECQTYAHRHDTADHLRTFGGERQTYDHRREHRGTHRALRDMAAARSMRATGWDRLVN